MHMNWMCLAPNEICFLENCIPILFVFFYHRLYFTKRNEDILEIWFIILYIYKYIYLKNSDKILNEIVTWWFIYKHFHNMTNKKKKIKCSTIDYMLMWKFCNSSFLMKTRTQKKIKRKNTIDEFIINEKKKKHTRKNDLIWLAMWHWT